MKNPKSRKQIARERSPSPPPSSDSYDEMDDGYILINDNTNEVRWNGDQTKYVQHTPTTYQAAVMTAKEAWENLGVRTVQQVVGTAASDLTIKASELTTVATANVNMESIQHSVGTVASRIASVTSKVAYQAASKVPDLISPKQMLGFTEDGITVANRDTGSGRSMIVVQHAQVANDIWEPPINVFKMEENEGKSEAAELEKSLDEILEPTHKGNVAGRRRRTHQGHSGKSYHAKGTETPGPLRDDNKLSRKRWPRHGGLGDKTPSNDGFTAEPVYGNVNVDRILRADHEGSANNHYTKNTAQRLPGRDTSEVQDPKRRKHEGETRIQRQSIEESGSRFTDDGNSYDALGVSNVWKSPHKDLLSADRKKAISQRWENQQDRSARDDANRKVPSETGSRPSQIPLMAARGHRAVEDVGRKDMTQQALKEPSTRAKAKPRKENIYMSPAPEQDYFRDQDKHL